MSENLSAYEKFRSQLSSDPLYAPTQYTLDEATQLLYWLDQLPITVDGYCPACKEATTWRYARTEGGPAFSVPTAPLPADQVLLGLSTRLAPLTLKCAR